MIKRIKYVSRFAKALGPKQIVKLAEEAEAKNKKMGITGVLMASGELFFQVIEGDPEIVDSLYETILKDKRHRDVFTLETAMARSRIFPDWAMKKVDLDPNAETRLEPLRLLLQLAVSQRNQLAELTDSLGRLLWHEVVNAGLPARK